MISSDASAANSDRTPDGPIGGSRPRDAHVIVLGTDPNSGRGGIGTALSGFFRSLELADLSYSFVPTHSATAPFGRWLPWLRSFGGVARELRRVARGGRRAIAYIHVGGGALSALRKLLTAVFLRLLGTRVIMQLHGPEVARYLGAPVGRVLFRVAISPASALAVLTPYWQRLLLENEVGKPLHVIPNALSEGLVTVARNPKCPISTSASMGRQQILTMSRMVEGKGFELVVEAAALVPSDITFVLAGSGPLLDRLQRRVVSLGLSDRVRLTGWLDDAGKRVALEQSKVFVLPSSYDSFGMGFVEAMAHGLPVIALRWGPVADVVPDPSCGVLLSEGSASHLAAAIVELFADERRLTRMSRSGQRHVLEAYSPEVVGRAIRSMVERLLV